jgi:site-specific DNA-cytosine methylase
VFVVASARNDICPAEILFEFEGVRRDTAPSGKKGQEIANCLTKSPSSHSSYNPARSEGNAVVVDWPADKAATLNASFGDKLGLENQHINGGASLFVPSIGYCNDLAPTITSSAAGISRVGNDTTADAQYVVQQAYPIHPQALLHEGGGKARNNDGKGNGLGVGENGDPIGTLTTVDRHMVAYSIQGSMIGREDKNGPQGNGINEEICFTQNTIDMHAVAYSFDSLASNSMKSSNPISGCNEVELSKTLDTSCLNPTANQGGVAIAHAFKVRGGCEGGGKSYLGQDEKAFTISTVQDQQIAVLGGQHPNAAIGENISPTLTNAMGAGGGHVPLIGNMAVRRLTPIECERLQGFPDNYTNIKANCPDGPRYKALGNSWAVPVVAWIGKRINDAIA